MSSSGRIYISKDVLFNELIVPKFDLFPSSSNSTKSLDSYFSLSPNLSPPCVATIPPTNSSFVPLIPPGFSPLPTHSPITTVFVAPTSTSTSISVEHQNSEITTISTSTLDTITPSTSLPTNTHPVQTRSKSGIHNPRLHPSLFLTHSKPKTMKQALANNDRLSAMQQEYDALKKNNNWELVPLPPNR